MNPLSIFIAPSALPAMTLAEPAYVIDVDASPVGRETKAAEETIEDIRQRGSTS